MSFYFQKKKNNRKTIIIIVKCLQYWYLIYNNKLERLKNKWFSNGIQMRRIIIMIMLC